VNGPPQFLGIFFVLIVNCQKQLWRLDLQPTPRLVKIGEETGLVGPRGPRWENSFGYCVLPDGTLWATLGEGYASPSVLRRSPDGRYRIAIFNGSVRANTGLLGESINGASGSTRAPQPSPPINVSALSPTRSGTVLGAGQTGLYEIGTDKIEQILAFDVMERDKHDQFHWGWHPSDIVAFDEGKYLFSGAFGGMYLLARDGAAQRTGNLLGSITKLAFLSHGEFITCVI